MAPIVLLVDDDPDVLHGLARVLRHQPYRLQTARSGEEAIAALKAHDIDVVVSDEEMAGLSGNDLLAWIAEHCPNTMRIMLTGRATTHTAVRAINEGEVYRFFTKPCDDVELAITIRKAIEHRKRLRERSKPTALPLEPTGGGAAIPAVEAPRG
jgi:two-component system probable response regulator PhcQ